MVLYIVMYSHQCQIVLPSDQRKASVYISHNYSTGSGMLTRYTYCMSSRNKIYTTFTPQIKVYCRGGFPYVDRLTQGNHMFYGGIYRIYGTVIPDTRFTAPVQIDPVVTDSWIIPDPNNPVCRRKGGLTKRSTPGVTSCSTDPDIISEGQIYVASIVQQDYFITCHNVVNVTQFIANCEFDYCCCNETEHEDCYCDALSSYASACADAGVAISNWRSPTLCHEFIIIFFYLHR